MDQVHPHTIMTQVKKNLIYELSEKAQTSERHQRELYQFLVKEDLIMDEETFDRILNKQDPTLGIFKFETVSIYSNYPKPKMDSLKPRFMVLYTKRLIRFTILKVLAKSINKVMPFLVHKETKYQPIGIIKLDR